MARLGEIKPLPEVGNDSSPTALTRLVRRYLGHLEGLGRSRQALKNVRGCLRFFLQWCEVRGLGELSLLSQSTLESYQRHLAHYSKADGSPLSISSQRGRMTVLRGFLGYLVRQGLLQFNFALAIEMPQMGRRLPMDILSIEEIEAVFAVPDTATDIGLRNRAILETLYSTGIRRAELVALKLHHLDYERGTVMVREGKGGRDRVVPIGESALNWVNRYLCEVRVKWAPAQDEEKALFLSSRGGGLNAEYLTHRVRRIFEAAGLEKPGACHLFRHTAATRMLENGADVRFIQALLGHANLDTTQVYTRVSITALKDVHQRTHPLG